MHNGMFIIFRIFQAHSTEQEGVLMCGQSKLPYRQESEEEMPIL